MWQFGSHFHTHSLSLSYQTIQDLKFHNMSAKNCIKATGKLSCYHYKIVTSTFIIKKSIMATSYNVRVQQNKDYRKLADAQPSRIRATKRVDKLYELEVIEEDTINGKVKVYYTGYGSDDDEWRYEKDIVVIEPTKPGRFSHT